MDSIVRSKIMSAIHSKGTKPEMMVRRAIHSLGYRYSLHSKSLPGRPDMVFCKYKAIILINGCFWHGHNCHLFNPGRKLQKNWGEKIMKNRQRDEKNFKAYKELGWKVLVIWECALQGKTKLPFVEWLHTVETWLLYDNQNAELMGR